MSQEGNAFETQSRGRHELVTGGDAMLTSVTVGLEATRLSAHHPHDSGAREIWPIVISVWQLKIRILLGVREEQFSVPRGTSSSVGVGSHILDSTDCQARFLEPHPSKR